MSWLKTDVICSSMKLNSHNEQPQSPSRKIFLDGLLHMRLLFNQQTHSSAAFLTDWRISNRNCRQG